MALSYIDLSVMTTVVLAAAGFLWRQMVKMDERHTDQIAKMSALHKEQMEKMEERHRQRLEKMDERLTAGLKEVIRDLHQVDLRLARIEGSRNEQIAAVQQAVPGGGNAIDAPAAPPKTGPDSVEPG